MLEKSLDSRLRGNDVTSSLWDRSDANPGLLVEETPSDHLLELSLKMKRDRHES
jgi:hypothetical protein